MIGIFAIGEILDLIEQKTSAFETQSSDAKIKTRIPRPRDIWALKSSILRGLGIGTIMGAIPGAGAAIAAFITYGIEQQVNKKEQFGKGSMAGLAAPRDSRQCFDRRGHDVPSHAGNTW